MDAPPFISRSMSASGSISMTMLMLLLMMMMMMMSARVSGSETHFERCAKVGVVEFEWILFHL
jgi:hypothetical protein